MKTTTARSNPWRWFLPASVAVAILSAGCSTPQNRSFNDDFGEDLHTKPTYLIQDQDAAHFIIRVQEGIHSTGPEQITDVKVAALAIANAECQRRDWKKWKLDYTQDRNLGWMHVVVGEVTREKYVEPAYPKPDGSP
jgi:hypothetical protein